MKNENPIVQKQIEKVSESKELPHVIVCECGHPDYYHLNYTSKCYSFNPENIKDHERENEKMCNCTCKKLVVVIDTSLPNMIVKKEWFAK